METEHIIAELWGLRKVARPACVALGSEKVVRDNTLAHTSSIHPDQPRELELHHNYLLHLGLVWVIFLFRCFAPFGWKVSAAGTLGRRWSRLN